MTISTEPYLTYFQTKYSRDLSVYDVTFLQNTINDRKAELGLTTDREYLDDLKSSAEEAATILDRLSISYSEFFRNTLTFSILEQSVLPRIFNKKTKSHSLEIRIWSAGCAAGQEPYSLAILFDEYKNSRTSDVGFRIFATDDSEKEIEKARHGIFDFKSVRNVRLELAEKYFRRSGEFYLLDDQIKKQVDFSCYNLLDQDSGAPPSSIYGDFDLIMCSNVLFYYQPKYQRVFLQKIFHALRPGGFLVTGEAETAIVRTLGRFSQDTTPAAIFVKN